MAAANRNTRISRRPRGHIFRKTTILTMGSAGRAGEPAATRHLLAERPGIIRGIALDFTSSNGSGVVTIADGSSTGVALFSYTGDTDTTNASTGEVLIPCTDGLNVSNSTIADTMGLFFAKGLYVSYASATAGDTVKITLLIEADVTYHKVTYGMTGVDGSAAGSTDFYNGGPGILRGLRVTPSANAASTHDWTLKVDADNRGSNAGATVFTATDLGANAIGSAAGTGCAAGVLVGGVDEAGGAVTSPPGGGIPFLHGLHAASAQANAVDTVTVEYWIST